MAKQLHSLDHEAFYHHKSHAKARGIAFEFTYEQWLTWWKTELVKLPAGSQRGSKRGEFGMLRFFDCGPYAPGNVYCGNPSQNRADYCRSIYLNSRVRPELTGAQGIGKPQE